MRVEILIFEFKLVRIIGTSSSLALNVGLLHDLILM